MKCLYCGDCCERMSPLTIDTCPHIVRTGNFIFCGLYSKRPEQCRNHEFPANYCPIGIDKLYLKSPSEVAIRIDKGWELIKGGLEE